jgi:hypothetical protein
MFSFLRKKPTVPRAGQPAAAGHSRAAPRQPGPEDAHVETIDEWFVRTTRRILNKGRRDAEPDGKRRSPHAQRIDALEQANAALKADNERLSSEVVALRTLLYAQERED